ncbi:CocE/NonD family hydrolase [Aquincola sp. S2]|uniref:CocE/NonD family hydrolase n=1 Tax=Pseudaquabacterium terrae TaxID=2732868 RepID=A0ABX2ET66_9BURK|nr:CocE/NonD family hydrolase [Aquabacterium terrae]NRF71826.1 CocE/NonD family hydrolase [Aquabacterium terrae]
MFPSKRLAASLLLFTAAAHAELACTPVAPGEIFIGNLANPGKINPHDGTCWLNNLRITAWDGTQLTANVFLPRRTSAGQKFPAVVMVSSWAVTDLFEYLGQSYRLAKDGYVVLSYTTRGFWLSGGQIEVAGPEDVKDASSALDYLALQTPTDMGKVAMSGISYGSGISLLALAHDPRVKTVAALSTWGSLPDELYGAETPNRTWADVLALAGQVTGRPDPKVNEYVTALKDPNTSAAKIAEILAWARIRSPLTYVPQINARNAPVFLSKNFQDDLFTPNSTLKMFQQLSGPKKLLINQGIHAQAELPGALLDVDNVVYDQAHRWFDYWLKGIDNGIVAEPKVTMQLKFSQAREHFDSWPTASVIDRFYNVAPRGDIRWDLGCFCWLGAHGTLQTHANTKSAMDAIDNTFDTTATSGVLPILSTTGESLGLPVLTWLPSVLRGQGVRYEGPTLVAPLKLRGIPRINLRLKPSQGQAQAVAYLYDVDALGTGTLITHGARTLHFGTPGQVIDFPVDFVATAYDVPAGHRIAVVIDTRDHLVSHPSHGRLDMRFVFDATKQSTLILPSLR